MSQSGWTKRTFEELLEQAINGYYFTINSVAQKKQNEIYVKQNKRLGSKLIFRYYKEIVKEGKGRIHKNNIRN